MSASGETVPGVAVEAPPRVAPAAEAQAATRRRKPPVPALRESWWRYVVSGLAIAVALYPMLYVLSAAFDPVPSLSSASLIPSGVTLDNFRALLNDPANPFLRWYLNSVLVALATAVLTVLLGALAAYAFARFRFRGRRLGMLGLLLVQMFPQLLLVVAIYLILLETGKIFPFLGLNTLTALVIVYLGGALGVNTWLMKGFFDSIPNELDESARVDGATPGQVFWGLILPLGAPVLAVVGLLSFITTLNEFILASRLLQTAHIQTLPVGMFAFIADQYGQQWGPFCAGVLLAALPVVVLFLFLQRFIVQGLTQGSVKG